MSCVEVNDENSGVCPGGKQHNSTSNDIFLLDQPTGRPSILRQTENLPSKPAMPKGVKVCFQTPRRDPVTKRIVSPTKSTKMSNVDECTKALESLNLDKKHVSPPEVPVQSNEQKTEVSTYPDDDMPIQSRGGYQLDFDNLDSIDPFQCSNKMVLSPLKLPAAQTPPPAQSPPQDTEPEDAVEKPATAETVLDETLPFTVSAENSLADVSANISSTESSVVTVTQVAAVEEQDSRSATPDVPDVQEPAQTSVNAEQDTASGSFVEDAPLPARGSYNFDFDNLDDINPFQTGSSKIQNSPVLGRKTPVDDNPPEVEQQVPESKPAAEEADVPEVVQKPEAKPVAAVKPISTTTTTTDNTSAAEPQPPAASAKEGPIKLEFNFDDGNEVKPKRPPPKKLGKRPSSVKPKEAAEVKAKSETHAAKADAPPADDAPVPKGSYSFDFDKLDDPNFNPFGSNANMSNSPKCSKNISPELKEPAIPEWTEETEEKDAAPPTPTSTEAAPPTPTSTEAAPPTPTSTEAAPPTHLEETVTAAVSRPAVPDTDLGSVQSFPQFSLPEQPEQKPEEPMLDFMEDFVPGTTFITDDFDGQIDYLEQFGSSGFKESALRKQSLYLKFDPLLRESPKKLAPPADAPAQVPRPSALASRLEAPQPPVKAAANEPQSSDFKLIDAAAMTPILQSLVPPFPQPTNTEDAIIEVLKYSQKDMDEAMDKVQAEEKEKEEQWEAKYKTLVDSSQEMRKTIAELQLKIAKNMADQEKEKELAQMRLNEALLEKDQAASDLNSMERSFADLFKRLEKYKDVIEGYKKNQETLKACAQDHLERIKKEEQRYRTLKTHAEEKIGQANAEITEVRSKFKAEVSALQAQLRREQLKVQSLEKSLDQKEKEVEDLTKLCDELITKVQSG